MIVCEDLSKNFDDFTAVDGVNLHVEPGEVLALLGQNGAGKTTTVRMLNSVLLPTRGFARVAGYDVVKNPFEVRASVGVLTEQHGLYSRMSADEYLDFFGRVYRLEPSLRLARKQYLLDYFGLSEVSRKRIGEYSKGMRQKLALARALIHEPPVLLLDEPTSAMDPESARLVREHIASLRTSNRAIIICTHNLTEAETLADKIAIIYRGKILIQGKLADLKRSLLGPIEYEVRFAQPWTQDSLNLPEGVRITSRSQDRIYFQVTDPQNANPLVIHELIARQAPVMAVQEVPRNLEQVYLKAMGEYGKV